MNLHEKYVSYLVQRGFVGKENEKGVGTWGSERVGEVIYGRREKV